MFALPRNNNPVKTEPSAQPRNTVALEPLLVGMTKYGLPRLSLHEGGWYCALNVSTAALGAELNIKSDFNNPSPLAAASQCHDRLLAALRSLGVKA